MRSYRSWEGIDAAKKGGDLGVTSSEIGNGSTGITTTIEERGHLWGPALFHSLSLPLPTPRARYFSVESCMACLFQERWEQQMEWSFDIVLKHLEPSCGLSSIGNAVIC